MTNSNKVLSYYCITLICIINRALVACKLTNCLFFEILSLSFLLLQRPRRLPPHLPRRRSLYSALANQGRTPQNSWRNYRRYWSFGFFQRWKKNNIRTRVIDKLQIIAVNNIRTQNLQKNNPSSVTKAKSPRSHTHLLLLKIRLLL